MSRDRLGTAGGLLLALAAARATGWVDAPLLPQTPAGFLALASVGTVLLLLGAALHPPTPGRGPGLRMLKVVLAALPFLLFGAWESSGGTVGTAYPGLGVAIALAAALLLLAVPARPRRIAAALLLALFLGDTVLASAGAPLLPAALDPLREPVAHAGAVDVPAAMPTVRGERPGAAVRVPDDEALLAEGPGPWWRVADEGPLPRAGPVVRVLEEPESETIERLPLGAADDVAAETMVVVHRGPALSDPLDLALYDALVVGLAIETDLWPDPEDESALRDAAIAGWVRAGGLLIGPPPRADWPGRLARALGAAARGEESGAVGAQPLGLGHVVRAGTRSQALEVLSERSLRRPVHTAFDGLATPPVPPAAFAPWTDDPVRRRGQGALLAAFVLAFALLEPAVRSVSAALAALALPTLATAAGLMWASPGGPDLAGHAAVLDLGGPGGKRVEVLWLTAGTRGYAGRVAFAGGGAVRWVGPPLHADGRVALPPGSSGWAIRRLSARGIDPSDVEDRRAALLRPWLRGPVAEARVRYGSIARAPVRVEGLPPLPAWTLTYR